MRFAIRQLRIEDNAIHVDGSWNNSCSRFKRPPISLLSHKFATQTGHSSLDTSSNLLEGTNNVTRSTLQNDFLRICNTQSNSGHGLILDITVPTSLSGNSM